MIIRCGVRHKEPDFLSIVDDLMEQGLDEETATREAYAQTHPDSYDADDYDNIYSSEDFEDYEDEDTLSVDGFYDMFVPNLDKSTMEKAARILYDWYTEEGEEYMPDRSDVLDMCDAATDERDKQLVLYALGEISEDVVEESTNITAARYNPYILDELVNYYSQQDMMDEDDIWNEIVNKYHNEDLANDVLDSID